MTHSPVSRFSRISDMAGNSLRENSHENSLPKWALMSPFFSSRPPARVTLWFILKLKTAFELQSTQGTRRKSAGK